MASSAAFSTEILEGIQTVIKTLHEVSVSLDVDHTLEAILDGVHSLIPFDAAGIYVLDPDRDEILAVSERGYAGETGSASSLDKAREVVQSVRRSGHSLTEDVSIEPRYISKRASTATEMAVPIYGSQGRLLGALNIESDAHGAYDPEALSLLAVLAFGVAGAIERALLHRHILKTRRLEDELAMARRVMTDLLPQSVPAAPGLDVGARLIPWSAVGGDYYDFLAFDDGRLAVTLADVVGKGMAAALLVATLRASLRALVHNDFSLRAVLRKANRLFHEASAEGRYASLVYAELDVASSRLTYVNAGHPPPIHLKAQGEVQLLDVGGSPLGLFEDARYLDGIVHLAPGDVLVLYTDGIIETPRETPGEGDELYGVDRLIDAVRRVRDRSATHICEAVLDDITRFATKEPQDDRTVVVLKADS